MIAFVSGCVALLMAVDVVQIQFRQNDSPVFRRQLGRPRVIRWLLWLLMLMNDGPVVFVVGN
jgi:hypothetical protein